MCQQVYGKYNLGHHGTSSLSDSRCCPLPVSMTIMYVTCSIIAVYWWPLPKCFTAYNVILLCLAIATGIMNNDKMSMTRCHALHVDIPRKIPRVCQLVIMSLNMSVNIATVIVDNDKMWTTRCHALHVHVDLYIPRKINRVSVSYYEP